MIISIPTDDIWSYTFANEAIEDSYNCLENLAGEEWPTQEEINLAGKRILHYIKMPHTFRTSDTEAYSIVAFIQDGLGADRIQIDGDSYITTEHLLKELSRID